MKYYYDIDISKLTSYDITNMKQRDIDKYKKFITEIYIRQDKNNISYINQELRYNCFTRNFYRNIDLDITNTKLNKYNTIQNLLFNDLFKRVKTGNNIIKEPNQYKLNRDIDRYFKTYGIVLKEDKELYNQTSKKNDKSIFKTYITIDKNHLREKINNLDLDEHIKEISIYELIIKTLNKSSKLNVNYKIIKSGRLYSPYSNLNKTIRKELLHGYTEYDVSTASYQWLYDVATQIDKNIKLPLLKNYITNKTEIRYKFAEELGTSYEVIKEIITSLGFGANSKVLDIELYNEELLEVVKVQFSAIENILSDNKINVDIWKNSKSMQNFILEVNQTMKIVSDYHKTKYYNSKTKIFTISKKTLKFEKRYSKSKVLGFLYQMYESNFLLSMRDAYIKETKNKDVFLLHDALFVLKDIDIKKLENAKQKLEFKINWKLERE